MKTEVMQIEVTLTALETGHTGSAKADLGELMNTGDTQEAVLNLVIEIARAMLIADGRSSERL